MQSHGSKELSHPESGPKTHQLAVRQQALMPLPPSLARAVYLAEIYTSHVPNLTLSDRQLLSERASDLADKLHSAQSDEAALILGRLAVVYPSTGDDRAQKARWFEYLRVLSEVPTFLLSAAVDQWLASSETWMPTPGQLLRLAEPKLKAMQSELRAIHRLLNAPDEPAEPVRGKTLSEATEAALARTKAALKKRQ